MGWRTLIVRVDRKAVLGVLASMSEEVQRELDSDCDRTEAEGEMLCVRQVCQGREQGRE